jgi:hypothetical protein
MKPYNALYPLYRTLVEVKWKVQLVQPVLFIPWFMNKILRIDGDIPDNEPNHGPPEPSQTPNTPIQ